MAIELEKILTISASEYCEMNGKQLKDYLPKGVQGEPENLQVPDDTEVVVSYQIRYAGTRTTIHKYGMGTALIPKK